ncbi:MAG: carbohydrate ABC transporter permease [Nitrospinaceae bacterium]|nr:MAG: carbohydrate ABC transporter permease [Nitrospinaceae bacterium]
MTRALHAGFYGVILLWSLWPFIWQWVTSVKVPSNISRIPPLLPEHLSAANYSAIFSNETFIRVIWNSIAVGLGATAISLVVGAMGAYGISRLLERGRRWIMLSLLVVLMLPQVSVVTPLYRIVDLMGWGDTLWSLIAVYSIFSVPLVVWVMYQAYEEIPETLHRAARVDGSSEWTIFTRVYLPLGIPGLVSSGLLSLIFCWNEFLFALTFTSSYKARTIPVGISLFSGQYDFPWGEITAASSLVTFPIILIVIFSQKYLVRGLVGSGVKG